MTEKREIKKDYNLPTEPNHLFCDQKLAISNSEMCSYVYKGLYLFVREGSNLMDSLMYSSDQKVIVDETIPQYCKEFEAFWKSFVDFFNPAYETYLNNSQEDSRVRLPIDDFELAYIMLKDRILGREENVTRTVAAILAIMLHDIEVDMGEDLILPKVLGVIQEIELRESIEGTMGNLRGGERIAFLGIEPFKAY